MNSFGLPQNTLDKIKELLSSFSEIKEVKIFGSRAQGNFQLSSDIDLAIFGQISEKTLRHIFSELDELPTPYKFDVIAYDNIENPALKKSIDTYGIKII